LRALTSRSTARSAFGWLLIAFVALSAFIEGTRGASADDRSNSGHSLQMLFPGPTQITSYNQADGAMPYTVAISDEAAVISSGAHTFRGIAKGMHNVAVVCPAGGRWYMAQPASDGSFSVEVTVPSVNGPMAIEVLSWDTGPNKPHYNINIAARFDLFVLGPPAQAVDTTQVQGNPAAGMKLEWADDFANPLSVSGSRHADAKWYAGGKPNASGSQYSNALFVSPTDRRNPFFIKDGFLRIRALNAPADDQHKMPYWWSGHLSTAFPDESASVAFRKGYAEVRMKMPLGKGAWPAFWLADTASILPSRPYGAIEIDAIEAYGHDTQWYMATEHRWEGAARDEPHIYNLKKVWRGAADPDGFHTYGLKLTDTEVIWYYDTLEVFRSPLYRHDVVSPFFIMIDLAMGGGWPIVAPPSGYYDLWIDYIHVYE
jgi:beta-glucanase (GH16 family)